MARTQQQKSSSGPATNGGVPKTSPEQESEEDEKVGANVDENSNDVVNRDIKPTM